MDNITRSTTQRAGHLGVYFIGGLCVSALLAGWWMTRATPSIADAVESASPAPEAFHPLVPPTGMEASLLAPVTRGTPLLLPSMLSRLSSAHPMRLSGIVTQPGEPIAVINDRLVSVGDAVGESQVVAITPEGVVLERNHLRSTLTFSR